VRQAVLTTGGTTNSTEMLNRSAHLAQLLLEAMTDEPGAPPADEEAVNQWRSVLVEAALSGSVVDRSDGHPVPPGGDAPPDARTMPATALRAALLAARAHQFDPHGLRLKGLRIEGLLDLEQIEFPYPLHVVDCHLADGLVMKRARFKDIHLTGSHVAGLLLDRISIDGDLFVDNGFSTDHGLSLFGAVVTGDISLCGAVLRSAQGWALRLDDANVMGSVFAQREFAAVGGIQAHFLRVGGQLRLANAVLHAPGGIALRMDGAKIEGGVDAAIKVR
jgi:hypothetical protein